MSQDNIVTIRGVYEAFARRDFSRMPFDPQIEWVESNMEWSPTAGMHRGPQAVIKEVFEPTLEKIEAFRLECDLYLDAGDKVVVTGCFLGRGKDTGHELNAPFAHIWTLRNTKIIAFHNYTDTANWLQTLYHVQVDEPAKAHA